MENTYFFVERKTRPHLHDGLVLTPIASDHGSLALFKQAFDYRHMVTLHFSRLAEEVGLTEQISVYIVNT